MTTLMRGNLWVDIDRNKLKTKDIDETEIIFKFKEYAQGNQVTIMDIEYIENDKYVCFFTIRQRTREDCRSFVDNMSDILLQIGKVKTLSTNYERLKED